MTGGNKAGKGKRAAEEFTVIDPVLGEFAVKALIDRLRKKPQIHPDELEEYVAIPEEYEDDRPEVMRKIRGLHTVYWKNAHTRRRLLDLMLDDREFSSEGDFLREKLLVYKQETLILHEEIRALEGPLYPIPEVFARPVALLE